MKKQFKKVLSNGFLIALSFMVLVGIGYVFAAPSTPPSSGVGVSLPLTVGSEAQTKAGDLTVSGTLSTPTLNATTVTGTTLNIDEICLAGDCQTTWPSGGGLEAATVSGAAYPYITGYTYHYGNYCYAYYLYQPLTYYVSGYPYTQYTYRCYDANFSVTLPHNLSSGASIVSIDNAIVWCYGSIASSYSVNPGVYPPTSYVNDLYFPYRTQATGVTINQSGNNIVVSGSCKFGGVSASLYTGIRLQSADVVYTL